MAKPTKEKRAIYVPPQTNALVVEAASETGRSFTDFVVEAALKEVARLRGKKIIDLIPVEEYRVLGIVEMPAARRTA